MSGNASGSSAWTPPRPSMADWTRRCGPWPPSSKISTRLNRSSTRPPSEHTLVYLAHDADALYVAARLLDSRADEISAQVLRQGDQQLWNDDRFGVILDPFQRPAQRLSVRGQRQRGAARCTVSEHESAAVQLGGYLAGTEQPGRRRLGGRDADSLQDPVLRSRQRRVGDQFSTVHHSVGRDGRLGVAQPQHESGRRRPGDGLQRSAAGNGSGRRPVDQGIRGNEVRAVQQRCALGTIAGCVQEAHAFPERGTDDQHGLFGDGGR